MTNKTRGMDSFYWCSVIVVKVLVRLVWARYKITGLKWKDIPDGPVILVANHVNWMDPVVIALSCPYQMSMLAKADLFHIPVLGNLLHKWGMIPINRGGADREALRKALKVLASGRILGLFPEGKRNYEGELQKGLSGAAFLALQSGAVIIPIGVIGTRGIKVRPHPFHLGHIIVNIGQPFRLSRINTENQKEDLKTHTDLIMRRIAELLPENSRGVYASQNKKQSVEASNRRQTIAD